MVIFRYLCRIDRFRLQHVRNGNGDLLYTGIARKTKIQKALYACDEITGLITATALVRPSKSIHDVKIKSIKKKWKDKSFAAAINRDEIREAVSEFDVELWEHCGTVLAAMQSIATELGLEGTPN